MNILLKHIPLKPMPVKQPGFALFSVLWLVAILSLLSVAMVSAYLSNTRATQIEVERIKAQLLFDSALNFAALSLASPRSSVVSGAIPDKHLEYLANDAKVSIEIDNEAAFIDLLSADAELIDAVLAQNLGSLHMLGDVKQQLGAMAVSGSKPSYRALRERLRPYSGLYQRLSNKITLHNGQGGVHQNLAAESVLELLPDLSKAKRDLLLRHRVEQSPSLFSSPIESRFFSPKVSAHYRIRMRVSLGEREYSRSQIIKMVNQPGKLFHSIARL